MATPVHRDRSRGPLVEGLWRDLRHGMRNLARTPAFSGVALATLALCLGANLTIFAVVDAVLLRPLPFPHADRLVTIYNSFPRAGVDRDGASLTSYYEWRGRLPALASLSAFRYGTAIVGDPGATQRYDVLRVTPEFLTTLGVPLAMGRAFTGAEMSPGTGDEAILTDASWRGSFGADPRVLGRTLRVDGRPVRVVGVLPSAFQFLSSDARLLLPLVSTAGDRAVNSRYVSGTEVVGRLAPAATLGQAQSQVEAHYAAHASEYPWKTEIVEAGFHVTVTLLHADHVAGARRVLLLLQAGGVLLLLIGGVNLAGLFLVRATGRGRELAIRRSLGATIGDVTRHLAAESVLLALAGGACGLLVTAAGIRLLTALGATHVPLGFRVALDGRLMLAATVTSVIAGLGTALPVAAAALRGGLTGILQSDSRAATASAGVLRVRHTFIVAQTALAFVLLSGAGLLGVSLEHAMAVSPGFRADHVLTGRLSLPATTYPRAAPRLALADRLLERLAAEPGVVAAGVINAVPLGGQGESDAMTVVGYRPQPGVSPILHGRYGVTGDYFSAMGIPLREGRFLTSEDSHGEARVCVVDVDFARHYWPTGGALGQRVFEGPPQGRKPSEAFTVVGVVGAIKQNGLTDSRARGAIYFPYRYNASPDVFVAARTRQAPESFAPTLQALVRRVDPELPVDDLRPMELRVADSLVARSSPALVAGIFGAISLLLAAIGIYGVMSYSVVQRRREIGIRLALGARSSQIGREFLVRGLRLLAIGMVLGVAGAFLAERVMRSALFDVAAMPVAVVAGATAVLSVAAFVACLLPSWRAASLSPLTALVED